MKKNKKHLMMERHYVCNLMNFVPSHKRQICISAKGLGCSKAEMFALIESNSKLYLSQRFPRSLRKMKWRLLKQLGTLILLNICQGTSFFRWHTFLISQSLFKKHNSFVKFFVLISPIILNICIFLNQLLISLTIQRHNSSHNISESNTQETFFI